MSLRRLTGYRCCTDLIGIMIATHLAIASLSCRGTRTSHDDDHTFLDQHHGHRNSEWTFHAPVTSHRGADSAPGGSTAPEAAAPGRSTDQRYRGAGY
jgi:hypothetical protein